jgi:hypothetical protein
LATLLAGLLVVVAFVPLSPTMPTAELDPVWQLSINEAVSRGLQFGRDVVFTYGPAASVVTGQYHPSIYGLVLLWSVLLGAGVAVALAAGVRPVSARLLVAVVMLGVGQREALVLVAPALGVLGVLVPFRQGWTRVAGPLAFGLTISVPLLAKGSMAVPAGVAIASVSVGLLAQARWAAAAIAILGTAVTCVIGWLSFGQDLRFFRAYLTNTLEFSLGYTEAMQAGSLEHDLAPFVISLAVGLGAAWIIARAIVSGTARWALLVMLVVTVILIAKLGYVRADVHVLTVPAALAVLLVLVWVSGDRRRGGAVLAGASATWLGTAAVYGVAAGALSLPAHQVETLSGWTSAVERSFGHKPALPAQFAAALAAMRPEAMPGSGGPVDAYTWDQASAVASGLEWSPRPVFQSYAAYSPALAGINVLHLSGPHAPTLIRWSPGTIDERLPGLDDGPSYPTLLREYAVAGSDDEAVWLRRRLPAEPASTFAAATSYPSRLGEWVVAPGTGPLFLSVDARPSALGQLALTVYKSEPLRITVELASGRTETYRLPAGMARAGALVSPLLDTTSNLVSLFEHPNAVSDPVVRVKVWSQMPAMWQDTVSVSWATISAADQPNGSSASRPPLGETADGPRPNQRLGDQAAKGSSAGAGSRM